MESFPSIRESAWMTYVLEHNCFFALLWFLHLVQAAEGCYQEECVHLGMYRIYAMNGQEPGSQGKFQAGIISSSKNVLQSGIECMGCLVKAFIANERCTQTKKVLCGLVGGKNQLTRMTISMGTANAQMAPDLGFSAEIQQLKKRRR